MTVLRRHRERAWDVAAIAFALLLVLSVAAGTEGMTTTRTVVSIVVGVLGAVLLWWRRRWPIEIAVALAVCTILTDAVGGAELVAIFTVASRKSWRVTTAVVVLHVLASIMWATAWTEQTVLYIGILSAALLSIPAAWGLVVKAREEVIDSLRERAERAESESNLRAETVRGLERERIAREMHDALAHRISLVSLHAGALEVRPDVGAREVEALASTIRSNAHGALEDLREILGVLRSGDANVPRPQPGVGDIAALIEDSEKAGTQVTFVDEMPASFSLPASASRTVHRVIQEGLTNARKHAPGVPVRCGIAPTGNEIRVWLENGISAERFATVPGSRSGMIGLTERIELAGGRIEYGIARSSVGVVYRLEAWLPCPN
ncbi:histidine kinase [Rhodococcus sp. 06-462-5]|uniref:sensor histidine kinase n=1 Tax=unclassified Rhodococcus (in: high G+C Gram-positive bacteria) TaxID=192944 RepID=UPI000B9B009E|nr:MULTISPECIES: histidine kinase [unclassified Rhodococcus (in: high G+C Gram-positive bacteria)]OZC78711.1 histidine kinase [Rhodococcus sp. 06-462-5]OZE62015.1 histidine kinase [Rhodococcus sp. 02-925g]